MSGDSEMEKYKIENALTDEEWKRILIPVNITPSESLLRRLFSGLRSVFLTPH
jgi:hypothetical protein